MTVELGADLRGRIWPDLDWSKAAPALGAQIIASEAMTPQAKAPYLRQLAELCEFCVLDPQVAADLYGASYQADRGQIDILGRMRHLCEANGRFDHAARTAEIEFRQSKDPRFHVIAGQSWLDAAEPDRAIKPLLAAVAFSPGNPHIEAALKVARREWANPEMSAEQLIEEARKGGPAAANDALQAARILNMLDFGDERFEEALRLCLQAQPNLPSACNLLEVFLCEQELFDELAEHFGHRARAASDAATAAQILFKGSSLLFRAGAGSLAVLLFEEGLSQARASKMHSIPGLLAQLRAAVLCGGEERVHVVAYAEQVYDHLDSIDEQVGVAIFCGQIAWYAQKDFSEAKRWMERLRRHCSDHRLLVDFQLAAAILQGEQTPEPAPVARITPPATNPGASEKRRAPRMAIVANIELKMQIEDRMGTMTKLDAVTLDISTVGALIRCDKELKSEQKIDIVLHLPSASGLSKRRFAVKARVARVVPGKGFGLEWVDSDYDFRAAISGLPDPTS